MESPKDMSLRTSIASLKATSDVGMILTVIALALVLAKNAHHKADVGWHQISLLFLMRRAASPALI